MAYYLPDLVSHTKTHPTSQLPDNHATNPPSIQPYSHSTSINSPVSISSRAIYRPSPPIINRVYQPLPKNSYTNYKDGFIRNSTATRGTAASSKKAQKPSISVVCPICPKRITTTYIRKTEVAFMLHMRFHTKLVCPLCSLIIHFTEFPGHSSVCLMRFVGFGESCPICDSKCKNLQKHLKKHIQPYYCPIPTCCKQLNYSEFAKHCFWHAKLLPQNTNLTIQSIHFSPSRNNGRSSNHNSDTIHPAYVGRIQSNEVGSWERHTKGIGLKIMSKMGYIPGQGLGARADGVLKPVEAFLLPRRINLDTVMSMRSEELKRIDTRDKRNSINTKNADTPRIPTQTIDVIEISDSDDDDDDLCEITGIVLNTAAFEDSGDIIIISSDDEML